MLKTDLDKLSEPDVLLIARGILKGYIRNSNLFIIRLMFKLFQTKKKINKNIPEDIKKLLSITIAMYSLFLKKMEKEKALSLVKAVVIPIGLVKQYSFFRFVEEPDHSFNNLIKYSKRFKEEGPMRLNKMEIINEDDNHYEFVVKNCIFKGILDKFGYPELLNVFCSVDNALYNTYSPDNISFTRGGVNKNIACGNKTCHFLCVKCN